MMFSVLVCVLLFSFVSAQDELWWLRRIDAKIDKILEKDEEASDLKYLHEVAFGKQARQSSLYASYHASFAVDGDLSTYQHTKDDQGPFLMIDLGQEFKVKRIDIYNLRNCCGQRLHDLDITFGSSYNNMSLCAHYKGPSVTGSHLVFRCKKTRYARYVKLMIKGKEYLHVAEVKVYAVNN